jgi:hypothetical protein
MRTSKRLLHCTLALSLGLALATLLLWLGTKTIARAEVPADPIDSVEAGHATALTTGVPGWSPAVNVSDWFLGEDGYWLKMGADGTQAVFWEAYDSSALQGALWTRVRSPDGAWSAEENLSGWMETGALWAMWPYGWSAEVAPDGTVWAVRVISDSVEGKMQVMVDRRPPGGSWHSEPLSGWEIMIRSAELHIGPDGGMAAAWVACDTTSGTASDGNCAVDVKRRPADAADWDSVPTRVDNSGAGVERAQIRVGPGGLVVVIWTEANPAQPSQWAVMAQAYASGGWLTTPRNISGGWIEPRCVSCRWLAEPVMAGDGTVVAAWYAKTGAGSAYDAQYSNTRLVTGDWNATPTKISADREAYFLDVPLLAMDAGTTVAVWQCKGGTGSQHAIFANVRDPGSTWGSEAQVSAWRDVAQLVDLGVWATDGTAMVVWEEVDLSRPPTEMQGLFWSARHTSSWGDGGQGQLGNWASQITGAALELGSDGSAVAMWGVEDRNKPIDQQGSILVVTWPPGGSWGSPRELAGGYENAFVWRDKVAIGQGGRPVAAIWLAARYVTDPMVTPPLAVFHSQWPDYRVYLPLVLRNAP